MHTRILSFLALAAWVAASAPAMAGTNFTIVTQNVGPMTFRIEPHSKDKAKIQEVDSKGKVMGKQHGAGEPLDLDSSGTRLFQVNGYVTGFNLHLQFNSGRHISGNLTLSNGATSSFKITESNWAGASVKINANKVTITGNR